MLSVYADALGGALTMTIFVTIPEVSLIENLMLLLTASETQDEIMALKCFCLEAHPSQEYIVKTILCFHSRSIVGLCSPPF